jgi:hypothetical protein
VAWDDLILLSAEEFMRLDFNINVETAVRTAIHPGLALAGKTDARAVIHTSGNGHHFLACAAFKAAPTAYPARAADHFAATIAGGAGGYLHH